MTPRQQKAIQALLTQPTKAEAAKAAGVGASTLRQYMKDPEFITAYREAVTEILESTTRKTQIAAGHAVDVLSDIMTNPNEQAGPRVSAADKILSYALKLTEQNDIMTRLDALEAQTASDGI